MTTTINKASKLAELIADREVWEYFCEEHGDSLDTLCEQVVKANGGYNLMRRLGIGLMISTADEWGELNSLVIEGLSKIPLEDRMSLLRDIHSVPELDKYRSSRNRSTMIEILGLREWATKEDIIKSLSEVL